MFELECKRGCVFKHSSNADACMKEFVLSAWMLKNMDAYLEGSALVFDVQTMILGSKGLHLRLDFQTHTLALKSLCLHLDVQTRTHALRGLCFWIFNR